MFSPKITIDKELHKRAAEHAKTLGYSSLSEYVTHLLEQDMDGLSPEEQGAMADRLKGLGYL